MRSLPCSFTLLLALTPLTFSQTQLKTDAQMDGLSGPVESVSSTVTQAPNVKWQQPGGPTLVAPIWCRDCEYDPDGSKTKSGQMVEGKFFGETIQLVRDGNGQVTARYAYGPSGTVQRRETMGPFGKTDAKFWVGGKLRGRSTFAYDEYGHMTDWVSYDPQGKFDGHILFVTDKDGTRTRESVYQKNGELSYEQIFDPETQTDHFTTFDEFGKVKLTWTVVHGKLASFWELPNSKTAQFGENFTEPAGEGSYDNYSCHSDLQCDVSHVHYEYLDGDKHTPLSAEWRDSEGDLKLAAYFDYQLDSLHNWTRRRVWVWNPDLGQRTLSEIDTRAIAYWK